MLEAPLKKLVRRSTNHGLFESESEPGNKRRSSTLTVKASHLSFLERSPVGILYQSNHCWRILCSRKLNKQRQRISISNGNGNVQRHPSGERNKAALSAAVDDKFDLVKFTSIKWSSFNVKQQSMFL